MASSFLACAIKRTNSDKLGDFPFRLLTISEIGSLNNYSHFRNVQTSQKKDLLEADDAIFNKNFLDDIHDDKPVGCWSLQVVD